MPIDNLGNFSALDEILATTGLGDARTATVFVAIQAAAVCRDHLEMGPS